MTRDTDPQALRNASAAWREMGQQLEDMVRDLHNGVRTTREEDWRGAAAEAFDEDWSRFRQVVDEALPVFRMAAGELESAADAMDESDVSLRLASVDGSPAGGGSAESDVGFAPASSTDSSSDSVDSAGSSGASDLRGGGGYQAIFAVSALSQMGTMLGATFGRRGGGGQSGGSRLARSEPQPESTLPRSADPFGSGATAPTDDRRRGGLGIARGRRQPARNGESADSAERATGGAGAHTSPEPGAGRGSGSGSATTGEAPERLSPLDGGPLNGQPLDGARPARNGGAARSGERQATAERFGGPEPETAPERPEEPSPLDQPIGRAGEEGDRPTDGSGAADAADTASSADPDTGAADTAAVDRPARGTQDGAGERRSTREDATGTQPASAVATDSGSDAPTHSDRAGEPSAGDGRSTAQETEEANGAPAPSVTPATASPTASTASATSDAATSATAPPEPASPPVAEPESASPERNAPRVPLATGHGVEQDLRVGEEPVADSPEPTLERAARPAAG